MKTFFATAVLASAASALMTPAEIGQLVSGIFYEVGIESSLDDFTHCMDQSYNIEQDVTNALAEFKQGGVKHITSGVEDLVDIIHHLPAVFHACPHMSQEIEDMAKWTAQVAHPRELRHKVERNTALHIIDLKKDVSAFTSEMSAKQYFEAGETIGDILTIELGKVKATSGMENLDCKINDVATLVEGIIYGVSDEGHLADLSTCLVDADKAGKDFESALKDLHAGNIEKAVADLTQVMSDLTPALKDCKQIKPNLRALEQWLSILKDFQALMKQIEMNTMLHLSTIKQDIKTIRTDIVAEEYFQAGEAIADILILELGDMPAPTFNGVYGMGLQDTEQLIAGLIYGLVDDNQLTEIEACGEDLENLTGDILAAISDFKTGSLASILSGLSHIGAIMQKLPEDFQNCDAGLKGDLARIEQWSSIFLHPMQLAKDIKDNIMAHFMDAVQEFKKAMGDWSSSNYFAVGNDIADLLVMAIGPIPDSAPFYNTTPYFEAFIQ